MFTESASQQSILTNGMSDRGEGNVSGTKVRELIRKGDVDGIAEMTGYSKQIAQKLVDLREDNLM